MRSPRPRGQTAARSEAVSRRLAQLDAELTVVRDSAGARAAAPHGDHDGWELSTAAPRPGPAPRVDPWAPLGEAPDTHTRVRPALDHQPRRSLPAQDPAEWDDWGDDRADDPGDGPVIDHVPHPGRHAARRSSPDVAHVPGSGTSGPAPTAMRLVAGLVPETLQGRGGLGPAHLAVVAVLVSLGLGVTCWWVLRSEPQPLPAVTEAGALVTPVAGAPSAPASSPSSGAPPSASAPGSVPAPTGGEPSGEVVVDVAGRVRRPGIAVLPSGSRVVDALEAAGGARPGVDLTALNLARVLVDGEQLLVGVDAPPGAAGQAPAPPAPPGSPGSTAGAAPGGLVNINTADLALLDTLPGVGPVTAQAIVDWRTENGGFTAVDDLLDVSGIGEVTLAELTPLVTV